MTQLSPCNALNVSLVFRQPTKRFHAPAVRIGVTYRRTNYTVIENVKYLNSYSDSAIAHNVPHNAQLRARKINSEMS